MSSAVQHHPLITTKKYNRRQTRKSRHLSYLNSPLGESHLPTFLPTRISLCIFALLIVSSLPAIECAANVQLTETLHVREEQSIGTVVARLGNHPQAPPPFMATLWTPSIGSTIFSVDNAGVFTLLARLDRETGSAWYAVVLQSMKTYVGVKVVLNVTDFNDHSPTFSFKEFTQLVRVDETTPTDTRLILGSVSDRDLSPSPNSHLKCRLENGEPKFRLITSSLARGASELSLYLQLAEQLDYETRKRFSMRLVCSDSGLIKKIETTRGIEVVVLDSNDNAPVFSSLTYSTGSSRGYEVKVGENATRGHVVIRVNATDRDSGENGRVTYRLNPILDSNGKPDTTFILNSTSGELIVNGPLDAETKSTYELVVVAEDNGHHRLTDSVVIRVEVMDLNDNAPRIAMQYLTDSGGSQVTLDTLVTGDFIARFSVTDEDGADATAEFTVKLLNNPDNVFSLIRREHNVYFLAVNRVPSTSRVFSLRLRVIDSSGLASQIAFQVRTSRSSDPTPESPDGGQAAGASAFATDFYAFTLADTVSLKPGDHVMDLNLGLHSSDKRTDVRYSSSDPRFAVNSTSSSGGGHLEVTELWRGQSCGQDPISFTLTAHWQLKDAAKTPMKDNCTVTLTWFPVVNTRPRFHLKTFYEMPPLTLDTQLGTCFDLPVKVDDPDCQDTLTFRDTTPDHASSSSVYFGVDQATGTLCVVRTLGLEHLANVIVKVTVKDKYNLEDSLTLLFPVETSSSAATPVLISPSRTTIAGDSSSTYPRRLTAVVTTSQPGEPLLFGLLPNSSQHALSLLSIDQFTGVISQRYAFPAGVSSLEVWVDVRYTLLPLVSPLVQMFTFELSTIAHATPPFTLSAHYQTLAFEENTMSSVPIGRVQYTSTDSSNHMIFDTLSSTSPLINVDKWTGEVGLTNALDYEERSSHVVSLMVKSGQYSLSCQVVIEVGNLIDQVPTVTMNSPTVIYADDTVTQDVPLFTFTTKEHMHTSVKLTNHRDRFFIRDHKLYALSLQPNDVYNINAELKAELSITQSFNIVTRNTERYCDFDKSLYDFEVSDPLTKNVGVLRSSCSDVFFAFAPTCSASYPRRSSPSPLTLHPSTGVLSLSSPLAAPVPAIWTCTVFILSSRLPRHAPLSRATVIVALSYPRSGGGSVGTPRFLQPDYDFSVRESLPAGTFVGSVKARDLDNAVDYKYGIDNNEDQSFIVNQFNGDVFSNVILDYELIKTYVVKVYYRRTDVFGGHIKVSVEVTIHVINTNDNEPEFSGSRSLMLDQNGQCTVPAKDKDGFPVQYSIVSYGDHTDSPFFSIDQSNGLLTMLKWAPVKPHYSLRISLHDGVHTVEAYVNVALNSSLISSDLHDIPSITKHVDVDVNSEFDHVVTNVALEKLSHQLSSVAVIYSLEYGDSCGLFAVDSTSGDVTLTSAPNHRLSTSDHYGPLTIKALDVDVWRPSRTILIHISVRWTGDPSLHLVSQPMLRHRLHLLTDSPASVPVFSAPATPLQLDTPHHDAFTVTRGVLHLLPSRVDTPTPPSSPLRAAVTYDGRRRVILLDVEVNRTRRYPSTAGEQYRTTSISEASAIGTPVWFDPRVNTISAGNTFAWFIVEYATGIIRVGRHLNIAIEKEVILTLKYDNQRLYDLKITVNDDDNNNWPIVRKQETIEVGRSIKVDATDLDKDDKLTYALIEPSYNSTINENTGEITISDNINMPFETITFKGYVRDNGIPAKWSRFQRRYSKLPSPPYPSFASNQTRFVDIPENVRLANVAVMIAYSDSVNCEIRYNIIEGNNASLFAIHPVSGRISCNYLDYEHTRLHSLVIRARCLSSLRFADKPFSVRVLNVNDNAPVFSSAPLGALHVYSDAAYNSTVAEMHAVDDDGDDSGHDSGVNVNRLVYYSIKNNTDALFGIDLKTGRLYVNGDLRNHQSTHYIEIIASDSSDVVRLTAHRTLTIEVSGRLTSDPRTTAAISFSQTEYVLTLQEGSPLGTVLNKFDVYSVNPAHFTLVSGSSGVFQLDQSTGQLTTAVSVLDAEIGSHYALHVEAFDLSTSRSAQVKVTVQVLNRNDNPPYIQPTKDMSISEDAVPGEFIGEVKYSDVDPVGMISFKEVIAGDNVGQSSYVDVDSLTGKLYLHRRIKHNEHKSLRLEVEVSDGVARISTNISITILKTTKDLFPPAFDQDFYYVNVTEFTEKGHNLLTLSVDDDDIDDHVTLSLQRDYELFHISNQGVLSTSATLPSASTYQFYPVTVVAKDIRNIVSMVTVLVQVTPNMDWKPQFKQNSYSAEINEEIALGSLITSVSLERSSPLVLITMPSHGAGGGGAGGGAGGEAVGQQFSFTLRGEIRVVSVPPHAGDYTVRLRATHTVNLRHSEVTLFVRVLPSTNTLYRFSPSTLSFTDNTTLTLTPPANPADAVTFNLLTDASPFLIADARTLTPKATTLAGRYVIPVRAVVRRSDHSSVSVYADLTATISPALRPNVSPRLPSSTVYVSAAERSPSGTYAGRLIAYARQQDTVAFYAGNCAQLAVDRSTGVLTTRVRFDRSKHETHVICNFTATAESRGRLYRQYAGLRVYVQPDVNLQPRFAFTGDKDDSSGGYMFNAGVGRQGEVVGRVHIVSAHPVATPEYRLFPADVASPEFAINSTSGVITRLTARQGTRRRRSVAEVDGTMSLYSSSKHSRSRNKRSTIADVILHVIARVGNRETGVQVLIRASSPPPHPNGSSTQMPSSAGKGFSGTPMVLLIVLVCVGIVAAAVVVAVVVLRRRDRRRRKPRALADISTCHDNRGLDVSSTALPHLHADPKPHYTPNTTGGGGKGKGHNLHQPPIELPPYRQTLPEIPPESSGRGSAVDYDGDEEIRMINGTLNYSDNDTRAHDSGIARDSEPDHGHAPLHPPPPPPPHHQYLTSLGVPVVEDTPPPASFAPPIRLPGDGPSPGSPMDHKYATIDEIAAGSYNWDHLLGWTPAYQPLADVFAEIARLKDDNRRIQGRKQPTRIIQQNDAAPTTPSAGSPHRSNASSQRPPPMITDAPPSMGSRRLRERLEPVGYDQAFAASVQTPALTPQFTPHELHPVRIQQNV